MGATSRIAKRKRWMKQQRTFAAYIVQIKFALTVTHIVRQFWKYQICTARTWNVTLHRIRAGHVTGTGIGFVGAQHFPKIFGYKKNRFHEYIIDKARGGRQAFASPPESVVGRLHTLETSRKVFGDFTNVLRTQWRRRR